MFGQLGGSRGTLGRERDGAKSASLASSAPAAAGSALAEAIALT